MGNLSLSPTSMDRKHRRGEIDYNNESTTAQSLPLKDSLRRVQFASLCSTVDSFTMKETQNIKSPPNVRHVLL